MAPRCPSCARGEWGTGELEPVGLLVYPHTRHAHPELEFGMDGKAVLPVTCNTAATWRTPSSIWKTSSGSSAYNSAVKQIWTGRVAQATAKYGENAPMAAVCCNACRTCVTTNALGLAMAGITGAGYGLLRLAKRVGSRAEARARL
jgi:hypothetical protein